MASDMLVHRLRRPAVGAIEDGTLPPDPRRRNTLRSRITASSVLTAPGGDGYRVRPSRTEFRASLSALRP